MSGTEDPSVYLRPSASRTVYDQTKAFDSKKWVWLPDEEEGFKSACVKSTRGDKVLIELSDGSVSTHSMQRVPLHSYSLLLLGERSGHEHHWTNESAQVWEGRRHGWSNLSQRSVCPSQPSPAILLQPYLRMYISKITLIVILLVIIATVRAYGYDACIMKFMILERKWELFDYMFRGCLFLPV